MTDLSFKSFLQSETSECPYFKALKCENSLHFFVFYAFKLKRTV